MKKQLPFLIIICLALVMQGCPITNYTPIIGSAYILSPKDTVKVRRYDEKEYLHINMLYPLDYLQSVSWNAEPHGSSIEHSVEKHELHVQKLSINAETIVIEGAKLYINDELWGLDSFMDPSDTVCELVNAFGEQIRVVTHRKQAPYDLADVIEQLELNYPHLVHRLYDTEEHNFSNYQASIDISLIPKIYINK